MPATAAGMALPRWGKACTRWADHGWDAPMPGMPAANVRGAPLRATAGRGRLSAMAGGMAHRHRPTMTRDV
jgi:hypothetical protein